MGIFLKKHTWILYLVLVFIGTYFLAKMTANFIGFKVRIPKKYSGSTTAFASDNARSRQTFEDYQIIIDRNIFNSMEVENPNPEAGGEEVVEANLDGPAVKTSLPIKLISTFSLGDGLDKRSSATVTSSSGAASLDTYTIDDAKQFAPGVKIKKILPDRIEFVNGSRLEYAEIEDFGGGISTGEPTSAMDEPPMGEEGGERPTPAPKPGVEELSQGKFVVDRAEIQAALSNMDQLLTQIRAVPQFKDGKASGLRLLSVRAGSLFGKLGLQRNDVLEQINGQPVDIKKGMEVFEQLKTADRISIDLVRGGKKTSLDYNIQ